MPKTFLQTRYPQNYLIRRPLMGALILFGFSFLFTLMYHPVDAKESLYFGFEFTMLIYSGFSALIAGIFMFVLKFIPALSKIQQWTIGKELSCIFLILLTIGTTVFLLGFAIEGPAVDSRWNLATFINSFISAFLIYILPFAFFSISNYKFLVLDYQSATSIKNQQENHTPSVMISSQLKKESLSFSTDELIYAVADGNYVVFHLLRNEKEETVYIRNSIADVTKQLSDVPFFFRCHRGFIVNLQMVTFKKGNSSGYLLQLKHTTDTIPVSRKNTADFEMLMEKLG